MGVVNMRGQRWQYEADHESHSEADEKPQQVGEIRDIHDLRDDRGQAGAVKTDVNVTGQMCFMVVGVEVHTKQDRPDI